MESKVQSSRSSSSSSSILNWAGPHTVVIPRGAQSDFGFTLRHLVVFPPQPVLADTQDDQDHLSKGPCSHLSRELSLEPQETIFVKSVKEGSPAYYAGLKTGDRVLAVNGISISDKSYRDVIGTILQSGHTLRLLVVPKDDDILQLAYEPQVRDCRYTSRSSLSDSVRQFGVNKSSKHRYSSSDIVKGSAGESFDFGSSNSLRDARCEIRHSYPLSQWGQHGAEFRLEDFSPGNSSENCTGESLMNDNHPSQVVTDTACHSQPQQQPESVSQDLGNSMTSNITYNVPSRSRYSFGLYFPPKAPALQSGNGSDGHCVSAENIDKGFEAAPDRQGLTKSQTFELSQKRPSTGRKVSLEENSALSSSAKSREFFIRYSSDKAASDNRNRYSPRYSTYERYSNDTRPTYIISRSQTVSTLSPSSHSSGYVQSLRKSPDYLTSSQVTSDASRTCQYIPIISENKQQTSAVRSENGPEMGGSAQTPLCSIKTDLSTGSRTFVLSIPCGQQVQQQSKMTESSYTPERQTFGTTAALIRSHTAAHNEIQKSIGKPIVSQRKYQFESKHEHTPPPGNDGSNPYKSEIEKIRTQARFSSIAMRKASFEQSPDRDPPDFDDPVEHVQSPSVYSSPSMETVKPPEKVRLFSAEKYNSGSLPQLEETSKTTFINGNKDNTSIRIFVSTDKNGGIMSSAPMSSRQSINQSAAVENVSRGTGLESFKDGRFASTPSIMGSSSISSGVGGGESSSSGLADSGVWVKSYLSSSDMLDETDDTTDHEGSAVRTSESSDKTNNSAVNVSTHRSSNSIISVSSEGFPVTSKAASAAASHGDRGVTVGPVSHGNQTSAGPDNTGSININVAMRKRLQDSLEDQTNKLHRRTSYLMATARDRTNVVPLEETFSATQDAANLKQNLCGTARRNSAVKLNKFFGEMIPSIAEGTEGKPQDLEESPEIIRKGPLSCKISTIEGKKCSDRSWKSVYAILRPTELFLTRDKEAGSASGNFEDQHIPLRACTVEFAREYAKKKKNVFRLSTQNDCDYLFQTEDRGMMMCWIQGIKSVSETERTEKEENQATGKEKPMPSPIEINIIPSSKTSPQMSQKSKKLSALSFKAKLTASPNMKRKKSNATEKDKEEGFKKGWKDRIPMMKSLKKHCEDSSHLLSADQDIDTDKFQFGVPLEDCFPSPHNEYVPLIVELCTRIVEARGLEVVGVYRVPGNSAAVTALTEEFNRGIDSVNIDNEKLLDINVISSLLKSFFRKLPEPLIPTDMYERFIEANRYPDEDKRKLKIKRLLHLLPAHHNETLKRMAEHLNKVASYGNINKMDAKNLAIMFGPTLVRKKGDDTVSLVTDMSDQCRIVESIILHHDWFFSPWDQDSYIPMETTVETVPVDGGQNLSKDDDEEADSAISTKEIISSIVGAASKKLRQQQQQKSTESLDMVDSTSVVSMSSSRDHNMSEPAYLPSFAKSLASINSSLGVSEEFLGSRSSVPSTVYLDVHPYGHSTSSTRSYFPELDYAGARSPSSGHSGHASDDYMEDKNDELEISHGLPTSLSQDAINRLKRIEEDVSALLHTFEQKQQKERERRKREQEMVEREHFRTQLELEQEDNHSVEDWLAWETGFPSLRMPDLVSSSYTTETSGQGFSGIGASTRGKKEIPDKKKFRQSKLKVEPSSHTSAKVASVSPQIAGVIPGAAQQCRICRRGSHEDVLSHSRRPVVISKPNQQSQDNQQKTMHLTVGGILQRQLSTKNSQGRRGGSLDSLIDMIDKQDKRISWASTDSEDGSDLLTSITTTFDQKLEILLNPKYKLTGSGKKNSKSSNSTGSTNDGSDDRDAVRQMKSFQTKSPLSPKQSYTVGSLLESHRAFRDPSLHRTTRSDPKIGIASRFERNDIGKTVSSPLVAATAPSTSTNLGHQHRDETVQMKTGVKESPSQVKDYSHVLSAQSKSGVKAEIHLNDKPRNNVSESDKAEQNVAGASFSQKPIIRNKDTGREVVQNEELYPAELLEKHVYRRHSVGGIEDFVHTNTLSQLYGKANTRVCSAFGYKLPIFKPFQVAVKHSNSPGSLTLQA